MDQITGTYDLILESVGGASLEGALHRVAAYGTIVMFGNSTQSPTTFPGFPDFRGRTGAKLQAFGVYYSGEVPTFGEDLGFLAALIGQGRLDPLLGATASWTQMAEVLGNLKARRFSGKAVFTVD
jgi:NADPH2:quinone reductase